MVPKKMLTLEMEYHSLILKPTPGNGLEPVQRSSHHHKLRYATTFTVTNLSHQLIINDSP